ncbi:MAG: BTAD domain-containing putative transcriptional regulator [Gaiellaceae bacterium]
MDLEFRILGPLEVIRDEQALPLGSPKQRALLGLLVVHANEPVGRERLIEELWGDAAPKTVNAVLGVYLSRLRRLLANGTGEQLLHTHAAGYVLRVPPDALDVQRFEALLEQGRRQMAGGEPERASPTLRDALALWRGPALADLAFERFAQTEIARLEELRLTALETRIEADLALGRQDSLVAELETLVSSHPYREGLRAQLMLALYRSGRQAEALESYRGARRAFSEELGIEPGPRLQKLEVAILRHDSSLEAPGSEAPRAREEEGTDVVREKRRLPTRRTLVLAVALGLLVAAALVGVVARDSSGPSGPVELAGDSVVAVDPATDRVVAEIPVGGIPVGPGFGEGGVWVGNRDDKTLLKIDASSRDVVHRIGLGVVPTDVEVGAGSVWVLSDKALLRVDAAINDVVETIPLPQRAGQGWTQMEVSPNAVYVCSCTPIPGTLLRIDAATTSDMSTHRRPVGSIAYGEGALWALTGYESDSIDRIDPETKAVDTTPLGRIGESHGYRARITVAEGAIWLASRQSLWRFDPATKRLLGSVHVGPRAEGSVAAGPGAVWIMSFSDRALLRVDPDSETVAKTIPFGALIYPVSPWDGIAVGEGLVWVAVTSFAS